MRENKPVIEWPKGNDMRPELWKKARQLSDLADRGAAVQVRITDEDQINKWKHYLGVSDEADFRDESLPSPSGAIPSMMFYAFLTYLGYRANHPTERVMLALAAVLYHSIIDGRIVTLDADPNKFHLNIE